MLLSERLRSHGADELFYLIPLDNLELILRCGILCKKRADEYPHTDISNRSVQRLRHNWHEHVPLFFADNTPMLFNACKERQPDVVLLSIAINVTDREGVWVADGNAASAETEAYENPGKDELASFDWKVIRSRKGAWSNARKRIRHAEVLIPEICPTTYIQGVYFQSHLPENTQAKLREIVKNSPHSREIFLKSTLTQTGIARPPIFLT